MQKTLDDLVDRGYVHRADITDHIMQALEGVCTSHRRPITVSSFECFGGDMKYLLVTAHTSCHVLQSYQMQMHNQPWTALARAISAVSTTKGLS